MIDAGEGNQVSITLLILLEQAATLGRSESAAVWSCMSWAQQQQQTHHMIFSNNHVSSP
jgi:hypothetical protein